MIGKSLRWGTPNWRVCWLARPTIYDKHMPDYCTLEYVFSELIIGTRYAYRQRVTGTTNQSAADEFVRTMYSQPGQKASATTEVLHMHTQWVTPDGKIEKKFPIEPIHYVQEGAMA